MLRTQRLHEQRTLAEQAFTAPRPLSPSLRWLGVTSGKGRFVFSLLDSVAYEVAARYSWNISSRGYVETAKGPVRFLHHLAVGVPAVGFEIDHINRDKLDNRSENLRHVTHAVNMQNRAPHLRVVTPVIAFSQGFGKKKAS